VSRQLERDEAGIESVRRIVRREAGKALDSLPSGGPPRDVALHDARKRIKRARAALRLVRKPLGERAYRRENEELRDAARPLSPARDAKILVEAFDRVAGPVPRSGGTALARARDALVRRQLRARRRLVGSKSRLKPTRRALRSVRKRAREWTLGSRSWRALGAGLDRVYRAGRSQLALARRHPSDTNLHELRKQAKYFWQQLEILEPIAPSTIRPLARSAHELSSRLGEDHDLAVLRARLRRSDSRTPQAAVRLVSGRVVQARAALRAKAFDAAQRVYGEDPDELAKRLEARWRAWRKSSR
jgi:CHAD domain-containing protein